MNWIPTGLDNAGEPPLSQCLIQTGRIVRSDRQRRRLIVPLTSMVPGEEKTVTVSTTPGAGTLTIKVLEEMGYEEAKELDLFGLPPVVGGLLTDESAMQAAAEVMVGLSDPPPPALVRIELPFKGGSIQVPPAAVDATPPPTSSRHKRKQSVPQRLDTETLRSRRGRRPEGFAGPRIAVDSKNNVYIAENRGRRIHKFRASDPKRLN